MMVYVRPQMGPKPFTIQLLLTNTTLFNVDSRTEMISLRPLNVGDPQSRRKVTR